MVSGMKVKSLVTGSLVLALSPAVASADLEFPVKGVITSGVGWRLDPFGTGKLVFHRGFDIAVPLGTQVHATRRGRVVLAGDDHHGHGATVMLQHDNGDRTLYGHNSVILVHTGEVVEAGTVVALSGSSGRSTGPHVHFEKIPSGLPVEEGAAEVAAGEPLDLRPTAKGMEREELDQRMEDSVQSILKTIRSSVVTGQGG